MGFCHRHFIGRHAIESAKAGNREQAKSLLAQKLKQEPNNARIQYLLSQVLEERKQAKYCLERALEIQPDNDRSLIIT